MKRKLLMKRGQRKLPRVPRSHYDFFMQELRTLLTEDGSFKATYLAAQIESKLSDAPGGASDEVRRERAIAKWLATEERNRETNIRLMFADEEDFLFLNDTGFPVSARDVITWCQKEISRLLGRDNPAEWRGSFSGGASTSLNRGVGQIPRKYQAGKDITPSAIQHYIHLSQSAMGMPRDLNLVDGNVMFTVPKTSEIDRCACKEPDLNMYCQKAVGDFIRRRLKRVGIDLNDQTVNQELARVGSLSGELATIDLSSASDSVTTQLVIELLPFEWSSLLLDLRSPITYIDGVAHVNEMISSMGNAFTFELESLVFWALVRACAYFTRTSGRISVYGDDIICPSGLKDAVEATLEFFGFKLNQSKSFWEGDFRESCGKHWFAGLEVTPFYVKKTPSTVSDWCLLLNSLRKWAYDTSAHMCDPRYYALWELFSEIVPRPLHGGRDITSRSDLVVPNTKCLARIQRVKRPDLATRDEFQYGAYLWWLDATQVRSAAISEPFTTNTFEVEGVEVYGRPRNHYWNVGVPTFPKEHGIE